MGSPGSRTLVWSDGPSAIDYSREDQTLDEAEAANRSGWDCRVHVEYEGRPAVDWYLPAGTPVRATMDGAATLNLITLSNAFDYYRVDREPYIGNPVRARAPLSPFPGPGGGKGVFVEVSNGSFDTQYAHLDLQRTLGVVPAGAFLGGYGATFDFSAKFSAMRSFDDSTQVAQWQVHAGDVIGYSGDSGYSEAPHLHYTVARAGGPNLCPTTEQGFEDGGWLFR